MEPNNIKALTLILTMEQSKALSKLTRKYRLSSTTVIAFGTISSYFLNMLGITSDRREIIKILMEEEFLEEFCSALNDKLQLDKPGHGIAYITNVLACRGLHSGKNISFNETRGLDTEDSMYQKITVIVDRGQADRVVEIAKEAGARGGTILHGRGSTGKEAQTIFGIEIEPEKEIAIIIIPRTISEKVFTAIHQGMDLDSPGKGIMFVEPIVGTRGLFESSAGNKA
ncbi:MAG: P-II family nitrogen regulator [Christensenellales bacterium]|jgi:nitrogen regulatory protein PII